MSLPSLWSRVTVRQTWVSLVLLLNKTGAGMGWGFTSSFLMAIKEPDSDIKMDIHTATWFASLMGISTTIGHVIVPITMAQFGRRKAAVIYSLPAVIGQLITYFSSNIPALMIGRVLTGTTMGGNSVIGIIIVGECVSPKNRGMFLNMGTASLNIGSLIVHAVGYYTSWRTLTIVTAVPFILCLIVAYTSPESPSWLAERKQYEKSREAFYWLRERTEDATKEIEELIRAQHHKKTDKTFTENVKSLFLKFKKKNFLKPLWICFVSYILIEASGRHIFPSYAGQLIKDIMPAGVNTYYYHIVVDILIIIAGFAAAFMIRVMKMRTLLFTTGAATAAVLCLACVSLYLVKNGVIPEDYSVLSLVLFAVFFTLGNTGCTCIPYGLSGELFPLEHKAVASILLFIAGGIVLAVILKIMPYMISALYIYGAFLVLAVCMSMVLILLYFILPETTNKTLQEIEEYFEDGKHTDHNVDTDDERQSLQTLNQCNKV